MYLSFPDNHVACSPHTITAKPFPREEERSAKPGQAREGRSEEKGCHLPPNRPRKWTALPPSGWGAGGRAKGGINGSTRIDLLNTIQIHKKANRYHLGLQEAHSYEPKSTHFIIQCFYSVTHSFNKHVLSLLCRSYSRYWKYRVEQKKDACPPGAYIQEEGDRQQLIPTLHSSHLEVISFTFEVL